MPKEYENESTKEKNAFVRLNAINVLNMQKEVKVSQAIAISLGLLSGVLIFCGSMLVLIAG